MSLVQSSKDSIFNNNNIIIILSIREGANTIWCNQSLFMELTDYACKQKQII